MKTSILIDPSQFQSSEVLPIDIRPKRASTSINFLASVKRTGELPALVLHNFDPKVYNIWYPPFHFIPWSIDREPPETYKQLADSVLFSCPEEAKPENHVLLGVESVKEAFGLSRFIVKPAVSIANEIWLKYSKSKQEWTVYHFSYYYVVDCDATEILKNDSQTLGFLPLGGDQLRNTLETDTFEGLSVVDNLTRLLSKPPIVGFLCDIAI